MNGINKRVTVYFNPQLHQALRLKAIEMDRSFSETINQIVRLALREDANDLDAFSKRAKEPNLKFEKVLKKLKADGKL